MMHSFLLEQRPISGKHGSLVTSEVLKLKPHKAGSIMPILRENPCYRSFKFETRILEFDNAFGLGNLLRAVSPSVKFVIAGRVVAGFGLSGIWVAILSVTTSISICWFRSFICR